LNDETKFSTHFNFKIFDLNLQTKQKTNSYKLKINKINNLKNPRIIDLEITLY